MSQTRGGGHGGIPVGVPEGGGEHVWPRPSRCPQSVRHGVLQLLVPHRRPAVKETIGRAHLGGDGAPKLSGSSVSIRLSHNPTAQLEEGAVGWPGPGPER